MRGETSRELVERFMPAVGAAVGEKGSVYFTGGVSADLHGWRETTVDIDLQADPEPAGFFEELPRLKEQLAINIELCSPPDFIPVLPGWRERSVFIARHGRIDFFHYDFYSQALAKIERWHERDREDVVWMLDSGLVEKSRLAELFALIKTALLRFPAIDPLAFTRKVAQVTHA